MSKGILSKLEDPNEPTLVNADERDVWQRTAKPEDVSDLERIIRKIRERRANA